MRPLPRPLQALITWTAILPLVLIASAIAAPFTAGWPDPLRTALIITVVVPIAVFWAVPTLAKAAQRMRGVPADVVAAACSARPVPASDSVGAAMRDPRTGLGAGDGGSRCTTIGQEPAATRRSEAASASVSSEQGR